MIINNLNLNLIKMMAIYHQENNIIYNYAQNVNNQYKKMNKDVKDVKKQ